MERRVYKLYGPPGTGKTTTLTAKAVTAASHYGPDRVGAVTFTRAAASELKERIAAALSIQLPANEWERRKVLDRRMPWIGTIHSIALKLGGGTVLSQAQLLQFTKGSKPANDVDDLEGYAWAGPGRDEIAAALAVYAGARHRRLSIREAWDDIPWGYQGPTIDPEQAEEIAREYEDFKRQVHRIDFEDMLERGLMYPMPVDILLADEVQDNSPLLWQVIDRWAAEMDYLMAGDPYQAIYIFSGAKPELFIEHAGKWAKLGDSHRLDAHSAEFAKGIIESGGHEDNGLLESWSGVGTGEGRDNTEFWLARTKNLLYPVYRGLEDAGIPYGYVRGGGPLTTKAAEAFRTYHRLRSQGAADAYSVHRMVEEIPGGHLPYGEKARWKGIASETPQAMIELSELAQRWGETLFAHADYLGLPNADYYERVLAGHGVSAFRLPARTLVGTIHSAKGKEADVVHLITSWAKLPYRSTLEPKGALAESCVAYVATTRHRSQLVREWADEGTPYPGL